MSVLQVAGVSGGNSHDLAFDHGPEQRLSRSREAIAVNDAVGA
jgi:hypothetical protein